MTTFRFPEGPLIKAEGGWARTGGVPHTMRYTVEFEKATAMFDLATSPALSVYTVDGCVYPSMSDADGYVQEISHFIDCISDGQRPAVC
ncbi:MAG: hypothetical protein O7G85_16105, partial [Planctomycetota bacterium]|nr:hypothetical protein [Planctomycetota bacterium]